MIGVVRDDEERIIKEQIVVKRMERKKQSPQGFLWIWKDIERNVYEIL